MGHCGEGRDLDMRNFLLAISGSAIASALSANAVRVGRRRTAKGRDSAQKKDTPAELIFLSEYRQKSRVLFYRRIAKLIVRQLYRLCGDGF